LLDLSADEFGGAVELLLSFCGILGRPRPFELELVFLFAICPLRRRPVVCISLHHDCWHIEAIVGRGMVLLEYSDFSIVEVHCFIDEVVLAFGLVSRKRKPHEAKLFVVAEIFVAVHFCDCGLPQDKNPLFTLDTADLELAVDNLHVLLFDV
jgi:hypothetical protein